MSAQTSSPTKVLLISGFRIFPTSTGGHIRTASITRALARMGYSVTVYSLAGRHTDYGGRPFSASFRVDQIEENLLEETNLGMGYGALQTVGRRLGYPRVWQHVLMRRGLVPSRLKQALHNADVVLSDMPWCPRIPGPWRSKPWLMVSHNLEYRLLEQGDARHRRVADWMKGNETRAPAEFDDILACAEEDRDFFRRADASGTCRIPILRGGVDPKGYVALPGTRERIRAELGLTEADRLLVFSGSRFQPNLDALAVLREFCVREAQFLEQRRVYVLALGSMNTTAYREGALIATGRVPEVVPYFAAADAGLNPITTGSGANVKLFEYLAAGLPVISTVFGVRGTQLQAHEDFLPYDGDTLKLTIGEFLGRPLTYWRSYAQDVWTRHRAGCDIEVIVRDLIAQLPAFARARA